MQQIFILVIRRNERRLSSHRLRRWRIGSRRRWKRRIIINRWRRRKCRIVIWRRRVVIRRRRTINKRRDVMWRGTRRIAEIVFKLPKFLLESASLFLSLAAQRRQPSLQRLDGQAGLGKELRLLPDLVLLSFTLKLKKRMLTVKAFLENEKCPHFWLVR
jgi:hypothetical protein